MTRLTPQEFVADGPKGTTESERPVIYMAGPTPTNETELGPVMEQIVEKFANTTDFVDPTAIHEQGGGGGDFLDIDADKWWNSDGSFNRTKFDKERARNVDDSMIVDVIRGDLDDALGFDGYIESFLDSIGGSLEIDPLLFDADFSLFDPGFLGIPFFDLNFDPIDILPFSGLLSLIKKIVFGSIKKSDGVMLSRKSGNNMVGAAMEVKEAHDNDIPVAVYDHSDTDDDPLPVMLDQHADYVTNKPEWAAAWLIDEAERRKQKEPEKIDTNG